MKRKVLFGALYGLVGLTVFGLMTKYDSSVHFPYTEWLGYTAKAGYLWFLAAGPASLVIGRRCCTFAAASAAALVVLAYCVLLAYEMTILKLDHNLFPIEVVMTAGFLLPCLLPGAVCDGIAKLMNGERTGSA